jgi:hypothetical protein
LPGSEAAREPLLDALLTEMRKRQLKIAWAAYRADWTDVLDFLRHHGFALRQTMVNYVADVSRFSLHGDRRSNRVVAHLEREDLPELIAMAPDVFHDLDTQELEQFYWHNPFYDFSKSLFAIKDPASSEILGVYLFVADNRFADPTKIDAAMPCFRLGAFGTERERHKRVNGLFSCVFTNEAEGENMMTAALAQQAAVSGLAHLAAQAPSDAVALCAWYDRLFDRQGSFPIVSRQITS